ncbi:MAG: hypothetical protein ACI9Y1_002470, partial [Lentisphaeria bacterium]
MNPIATVVSISGQVFVRNNEGELRAIKTGDVIFDGEEIVTKDGATVSLDLSDGDPLILAEGSEVAITQELLKTAAIDPQENAIEADDIAALLGALESGVDINQILDGPAAGGNASDGGRSFIRLARIVEALPDNTISADTLDTPFISNLSADSQDDLGVLFPSTLSLSASPSITEGEVITYTA